MEKRLKIFIFLIFLTLLNAAKISKTVLVNYVVSTNWFTHPFDNNLMIINTNFCFKVYQIKEGAGQLI